jgi:hypothetical protein
MASDKIAFEDKDRFAAPPINIFRAADANEIKAVVNKVRDDLDTEEGRVDELYARTVSVKDYGNNRNAVQEAIDENLGGAIQFEPETVIRIPTRIEKTLTTKGIEIIGRQATLWNEDDDNILSLTVTPETTVRITNIAAYDGQISRSQITTQSAHNCNVGDVIMIGGTTDANVDEIDPVLTRKGEVLTVYKVIDATNLVSRTTIPRRTYDLTAVVNLYKMNAAEIKISDINVYRKIADIPSKSTCIIQSAFKPVLSNIKIKSNIGGSGILFRSCFSPTIQDLYFGYGDDLTHGFGKMTYGIFLHGTSYGFIERVIGHNTRHLIDLQGNRINLQGYASFNQINNCIGFNNTSGTFGTHQGSYYNTFNHCVSHRSLQGFNVRGWGDSYKNCKSINDTYGCVILNDQAAGGSFVGRILFENAEFVDNYRAAASIVDNNVVDVTFKSCKVIANNECLTWYVFNVEAPGTKLIIDDCQIDFNAKPGISEGVININTSTPASVYINNLKIRIADGVTMPTSWSVIRVREDCNVYINKLTVETNDAGNLPTNLFQVSSGKTVTGYVNNVYLSGIKAGGKLHSQLADNQTFVNAFSHGPLQLGATTLTPV